MGPDLFFSLAQAVSFPSPRAPEPGSSWRGWTRPLAARAAADVVALVRRAGATLRLRPKEGA